VPPRSVVVTCASSGIGRAIVLELVGAGFQVFGTVGREAVAARIILEALQDDNPAPRQVVGREAKVIAALARLLPYRVLYSLTARARSG
jgi:NAD(P)-dependent dehydrogenase (short-subunit alcohol dehydrogenase family)